MDKRQDAANIFFLIVGWLAVSIFLLVSSTACQTNLTATPTLIDQAPQTTATTEVPDQPTSTNTLTTPQPTLASPTSTPTIDCLQQGGEIQRGRIYSETLGDDFVFQVYLPPCYQADRGQRYPVAYLLHGLSYTEDQWLRLGLAAHMDRLIADGSLAPFIVILPHETRFLPPQTSGFGDALVEELIPWADQHYRTLPEKDFRSIGGISRGAAWSVHIGFEHYQHFGSVGAHSLPLFEVDGGRVNHWVTHIPFEELPAFFIDIGRSDQERWTAQDFADQLNVYHVPHTWYLFNGDHTEAYWSAHLDLYLRWYGRNW
jgi:enterochelin esterase-like enzyme